MQNADDTDWSEVTPCRNVTNSFGNKISKDVSKQVVLCFLQGGVRTPSIHEFSQVLLSSRAHVSESFSCQATSVGSFAELQRLESAFKNGNVNEVSKGTVNNSTHDQGSNLQSQE